MLAAITSHHRCFTCHNRKKRGTCNIEEGCIEGDINHYFYFSLFSFYVTRWEGGEAGCDSSVTKKTLRQKLGGKKEKEKEPLNLDSLFRQPEMLLFKIWKP